MGVNSTVFFCKDCELFASRGPGRWVDGIDLGSAAMFFFHYESKDFETSDGGVQNLLFYNIIILTNGITT